MKQLLHSIKFPKFVRLFHKNIKKILAKIFNSNRSKSYQVLLVDPKLTTDNYFITN